MATMMLVMLYAPHLMGVANLSAQQLSSPKKVTGTVKDEQGSPMPGVNIKVVGTTQVSITDIDGKYSFSLSNEKAQLEFSFIGYDSQTISSQGKNAINVQLKPTDKGLNEVVVIGYGTRKAKDLTGNISSVSSKDFQKGPSTNAESLIASKIPGVQVLPSSGKPGAGSSFLIQGGASLSASNDPLIVIDNVPVEGWNGGPGMLSQLNPNDIENFTVLKDASATAIYGSRASNGVILITTKKGNKGKLKIDFSSNVKVSTLSKETSVLSADQYRALVTQLGKSSTAPGTANTDWQKEIFQNALAHDYNLSVSGAYKFLPFRISGSYLNQDGILKTGNYERATASLALNPTFFNNHLKVNVNAKGSYENERIANDKAIWTATYFDPTQPVYVADQTYGGYNQYTQFKSNPALTIINPVSMLEQAEGRNKIYRSVGNVQLDYSLHFLPDLHINVNAGYDVSKSAYNYSTPANYFADNIAGGSAYNANPSKKVNNTLFESYLFYSKELPSAKSKFDVTAGYSYNDYVTTNYSYAYYNAAGVKIANTDPTYAFDKPSHSIVSFYGRANYVLNEKYLLTATIRDDASSRFSDKHRWGIFPSTALAWKIKEESFLKDNKTISDLKLRVGYGLTGQQDGLTNYYPISRYTTSTANYQYTVGNTAYTTIWPQVYNPDLKWEQTATTNVGLDFGFFEHRITGGVNLYTKNTKDLLNSITIPLGLNFDGTMVKNIGSMQNKGIEFDVKAIAVQTKDLSWDVSFNATYNENKITKISISNGAGVGLFSDQTLVNTVGYSRNTFYLYHQVYDKNGKPIEDQMVDVNKDGLINASDRYISNKSAQPKYMLGFSTNLQYKKWSIGTSLHANLGNYIYYNPLDNTQAITDWTTSENLSTSYYKTLFAHNTQYEAYSDYYLQNASFLKMDNVYVGYSFDKLFSHSNAVLKINASVQNVFTITKFTGLDPETNSGSQNAYPVPRVFAIGLNLNF
jgi:iron complex outermembrane receptor protein